ncbi:DUF4268 domain-containing protein [Flavobacterium sp.]
MYSKEEAQKIKREFWIAFAEAYPKKWLLYDTNIKEVSFKFFVDNKRAQILLDIEPKDERKREIYFEKIESLKTILIDAYLPNALLERNFHLETGKIISRIWVEIDNVSINNKKTWDTIFIFFHDKMSAFEEFFLEYEDNINDLETNT